MKKHLGSASARHGFRSWADSQPTPPWRHLPLTHVTSAIVAEDIIRELKIQPSADRKFVFNAAYLFYGRPAYKLLDGTVSLEAACPTCLIFSPDVIRMAKAIYAFDTGAFRNRLYQHVLVDEMDLDDFCLEQDPDRIHRLIYSIFGSQVNYYSGKMDKIYDLELSTPRHQFLTWAYISLLRSRGRNEPDDRVSTIEIVYDNEISLNSNLIAIVVPDSLVESICEAPWLTDLRAQGVDIITFEFTSGKTVSYYQAMIDLSVKNYYLGKGII